MREWLLSRVRKVSLVRTESLVSREELETVEKLYELFVPNFHSNYYVRLKCYRVFKDPQDPLEFQGNKELPGNR